MVITREDFFSYCEKNNVSRSAKKYFDALKTCDEFLSFIDTNNRGITVHDFDELQKFLYFNEKENYINYGLEKYNFSNLKVSYSKTEISHIYAELGDEYPIIKNKVVSKYSKSTINAAISKIAGFMDSKYEEHTHTHPDTDGKNVESKNKKIESKQVNVRIIKRDPYIVEDALTLSNYQCEYNASYTGFISSKTERIYLEVHHLIPLKFYEEYPNLDVIENLVVLSPETHRLLHHGTNEEVKKVLKQLYNIKIEKLKQVDLDITFEELFELYFKKPKQKVLFVMEDLYKDLT